MVHEIMEQMNNIKYGWLDNKGNAHIDDYDLFSENYILQSPDEVLKNKIGVCWDQVELERYLFEKNNIEVCTYFIVHYDNDKCPTHTFLIYKENNKYYWFEHSWEICKGIYEFNNISDAIKDIKSKFIEHELKNNYVVDNIYIYKYTKPRFGITCSQFMEHCEQGEEYKH